VIQLTIVSVESQYLCLKIKSTVVNDFYWIEW
jgi:hypothetical protein